MPVEYVFAGLSVSRLDEAIDWYGRLLGRPPDILPNEHEAMWQLAATASVYLAEELAAVARRGIAEIEIEIETAPGLFGKPVVTDPDGDTIQLGENLSGEGKEQPADA